MKGGLPDSRRSTAAQGRHLKQERHLDLRVLGLRVRVTANEDEVHTELKKLLGSYLTRPASSPRLQYRVGKTRSTANGKSFYLVSENGLPLHRAGNARSAASYTEWMIVAHAACRNNHLLQIHAGAASLGGCGVVFPAPPAGGKSTLAAALALRGWRLLSDDRAFINLKTLKVVPFPRALRLSAEASRVLGLEECPGERPGPAALDMESIGRGLQPRAGCQCEVSLIVFLCDDPEPVPLLVAMSKAKAAVELLRYAVNVSAEQASKIDAVMRLVERASCFQLRQGNIWDMADALEQAIKPPRSAQSGREILRP